jgi:hypothetical protein
MKIIKKVIEKNMFLITNSHNLHDSDLVVERIYAIIKELTTIC